MSKLPAPLNSLPFPVIGSPLFIISTPKLVIAQCIAGVVGSMPALNARPAEQLEEWLIEITETLAAYNAAHPTTLVTAVESPHNSIHLATGGFDLNGHVRASIHGAFTISTVVCFCFA